MNKVNSSIAREFTVDDSSRIMLIIIVGIFMLFAFSFQLDTPSLGYVAFSLLSLGLGVFLSWTYFRRKSSPDLSSYYQKLIERDSDCIYLVYQVEENRFPYVSANIKDLLGYRPHEIVPGFWNDCMNETDCCQFEALLSPSFWSNTGSVRRDIKLIGKFGNLVSAELQAKARQDAEGKLEYVVISLRPPDQQQEYEHYKEQYMMDLEQIISQTEYRRTDLSAAIQVQDLMEPLRSIYSYVQLLDRRHRSQLDETGREFVGYVKESTISLQKMIENMITLKQIENNEGGKMEFKISEALQIAQRTLGYSLFKKMARIESGQMPVVIGNKKQIAYLFQQLLDNALKYAATDHPHIEISCVRNEGFWQFAVRDNGIGIPAEHQNEIFELFRQLQARPESGGTGIGLTICRRIVENHQGKMWVSSDGPGTGSTFYFTLPVTEQSGKGEGSSGQQPSNVNVETI